MLAADIRHEEALEFYRKSLAIREMIAAADRANFTARRDVALSHDLVATALFSLNRIEEARNVFLAGLAVIEDYARADPNNALHQMDLVIFLYKLAVLGDEPRARLERALAIIRRLDGEGKLNAAQKSWIEYIEEALKRAP